jgi:hypothetical protein
MEYKCLCGKIYSYRQSLHVHRKTCIEHNKVFNAVNVEAQPVEAVKLNIELEEQEKRYKQLLQEKDKLLEEQEKHFKKLLEEKDKRIEDQKQTIEFMKTITMQRPSTLIQEQTPIVQEQTPAPEEKLVKKHFNLKEYLNSRNPITIEEFYDNYKPTIEEYDNIFSMGFVNAIVTNFANYAKIYEDKCPIIVTNTQYERLRIYLYTKTENEQSWIEYDRIDAQIYMKNNIVVRFVNKYQKYISEYIKPTDVEIIGKIIATMSYSKVKINGYPDLKEYQLAYHIVREADLLSAYDIDRCVIYGMYVEKLEYDAALKRAIELFESRVLKYRSDNLFITKYSKKESLKMHNNAKRNLDFLKKQLNN